LIEHFEFINRGWEKAYCALISIRVDPTSGRISTGELVIGWTVG